MDIIVNMISLPIIIWRKKATWFMMAACEFSFSLPKIFGSVSAFHYYDHWNSSVDRLRSVIPMSSQAIKHRASCIQPFQNMDDLDTLVPCFRSVFKIYHCLYQPYVWYEIHFETRYSWHWCMFYFVDRFTKWNKLNLNIKYRRVFWDWSQNATAGTWIQWVTVLHNVQIHCLSRELQKYRNKGGMRRT